MCYSLDSSYGIQGAGARSMLCYRKSDQKPIAVPINFWIALIYSVILLQRDQIDLTTEKKAKQIEKACFISMTYPIH